MRVLDLFSGTGSATQAFKDRGHEVITVDSNQDFDPTLCFEIGTADVPWNLLPRLDYGPFHFVWASPPCTAFSVASISTHWAGGCRAYKPKTKAAEDAIRLVAYTLDFIEALGPKAWLMENPRGVLRKLSVVKGIPRVTVTYCAYGDIRMKPTDLFGYPPPNMMFRPMCSPGASCHEAAPRGSRTGTQGLKDAAERARVPYGLSLDLCLAMEDWCDRLRLRTTTHNLEEVQT